MSLVYDRRGHSAVVLDGASLSAEMGTQTTASLQGIAGDAQA